MWVMGTGNRRWHGVVGAVACVILLTACGGGLDEPPASAGQEALIGQAAAPLDSAQDIADAEMAAQQRAGLQGAGAASTLQAVGLSAGDDAAAQALPDMTVQTTAMQLARARRARELMAPAPVLPKSLLSDIRVTAGCQAAYVPPATLLNATLLPVAESLTLTPSDQASVKSQLASGPFMSVGDYRPGSPDELARMQRNAHDFVVGGEQALTAQTTEGLRPTHGSRARDAAFMYLLEPQQGLLNALRAYLLAQASEPLNDLSARLCLREQDGSVRDAWFAEASWLARYTVTYDAARAGLNGPTRLIVEQFIRRNAYFLAAQLDYGLNYIFPARAQGDYLQRGASAAATRESEQYLYSRFDTNGDCRVDGSDDSREFAVYAYANANGSPGPRVSVLSQWYNNRKSMNALAVGLAGALLDDPELVVRAKRYFTEWLTYSVYPDGSEGEYARNGDYCVANQGVIYAAFNVQGAVLLADVLARKGDRDLINFSTRDGLFGTEARAADPAKSIGLVIGTHLDLARGLRPWYQQKSFAPVQQISPLTHLGRMESRVFGVGGMTDSFHQLGLLIGAKSFPNQPIERVVLRDPQTTNLRWPGSTGNAVATGFGSWAGAWTDAFNVYPSALMLRSR